MLRRRRQYAQGLLDAGQTQTQVVLHHLHLLGGAFGGELGFFDLAGEQFNRALKGQNTHCDVGVLLRGLGIGGGGFRRVRASAGNLALQAGDILLELADAPGHVAVLREGGATRQHQSDAGCSEQLGNGGLGDGV